MPDVAAVGARLLPGRGDDLLLVELGHERHGGERLERAGRQHPGVRALGGEHLTGRDVGDQPGVGVDGGQRGAPRPGRADDPAGGEVGTADDLGGTAVDGRRRGGGRDGCGEEGDAASTAPRRPRRGTASARRRG